MHIQIFIISLSLQNIEKQSKYDLQSYSIEVPILFL